jgi:hypothetical protein
MLGEGTKLFTWYTYLRRLVQRNKSHLRLWRCMVWNSTQRKPVTLSPGISRFPADSLQNRSKIFPSAHLTHHNKCCSDKVHIYFSSWTLKQTTKNIFWDVMPCCLIAYWRFRRLYWLIFKATERERERQKDKEGSKARNLLLHIC